MASITKKIKKGRAYYYAVESKRVDGKPRIVWQKYLGTVEAIVKRTEDASPPKPREAVIFQAGGPAALLRIAERLGVFGLIDELAPKREQGPSVAHYIVLAALNRALEPCSKAAIGEWYDQTVLRRLWKFPKDAFSSQRFWDHMDRLSEKNIEELQNRLLERVHREFGVDTELLLYDTTNFFTFLSTTNTRCNIAQRGHSKQKRHDLRQVGLALLVSRDFQLPLLHRTYCGNDCDVSVFPKINRDFVGRYRQATGNSKAGPATLVFDKGNVSDEAMENLIVDGTPFVTALSANSRKDLLEKPLAECQPLEGLPGCRAAMGEAEFWGKKCRYVVSYTESFFTQQLHGVTQHLVACQKKLQERVKMLERWHAGKGRGKKPTAAAMRKSVQAILSPQHMKDLIAYEIVEDEKSKVPRLQYTVDHQALQRLSDYRLGRTLLVTDRMDWDAKKIIASYRNLSAIEEAFKNMKNVDFLRWRPARHWTEQKVRVHTFYCVLALLLSSLANKVAFEAGIDLTLPALLKELQAIREVAVIYPPGTLAHRKNHITLSRMTTRQKRLSEVLEVQKSLHQ